jgi:sporulation protein YqfC
MHRVYQGDGGKTMKRISQLAANWFDLPAEVVGTLPRIEWIGHRLQIENFQRIRQYQPELLRLQTAEGLLTVKGSELVVEAMYPNRILLTGNILQIEQKSER